MTSSLKNKPARMSILNIAAGLTLDAQFNPTEINEEVAVNWAKLAVLGLSHQPQQYQNTSNHGVNFELAFRAWDDTGNKLDDIAYARRFLFSLCYSSRNSPATVVGGAPPRILFVWPKLFSMTCVVSKVGYKHTRFNEDGDPVNSAAKLDIEEIRDFRLYSEDVRTMGTIRAGSSAPGQSTGGANDGTGS